MGRVFLLKINPLYLFFQRQKWLFKRSTSGGYIKISDAVNARLS